MNNVGVFTQPLEGRLEKLGDRCGLTDDRHLGHGIQKAEERGVRFGRTQQLMTLPIAELRCERKQRCAD